MVGLLHWVLTGTIVGWVVSVLLWKARERDTAQNVALGIFGAVFCGTLLRAAGNRGASFEDVLTLPSIVLPLVGATVTALLLSPGSRQALRTYARLRVEARQRIKGLIPAAPANDVAPPTPELGSNVVAVAAVPAVASAPIATAPSPEPAVAA